MEGVGRGLLYVEGVARVEEEGGGGAHALGEVMVRGCHEVFFRAKMLALKLACRPCTSLSALPAI